MKVLVTGASLDAAGIDIDVGSGKHLRFNVRREAVGSETAKNLCSVNVTIETVGPRGGKKYDGVSVGHFEFDIRRPILVNYGDPDHPWVVSTET
jgi:hypothetical protein